MIKTYLSDHKWDLLVILFAIFFSFAVWWPSRYTPYFWDSSGYVVNTAKDFYDQNFTNLTSLHTDFAHPPLFTALLALVWKIFGIALVPSHLLMFFFLPILLISTYYLAKAYTNHESALFAMALIAFSPAVLAEYVNIYVDLPSAALAILSLALAKYQKFKPSMVIFSLAVLTKLPILTLLPFLYFQAKPKQKYWLLLPIISVAGWLIYHFSLTGWWYSRPGRPLATPASLTDLLTSIQYVLTTYFIEQGRFAWSILVIIGVILTRSSKASLISYINKYKEIFASLLTSLSLFAVAAEFAPRYALYFLPLLALLAAHSLYQLKKSKKINLVVELIIIAVVLITSILNWRPDTATTSRYEFNAPSNLSILDSIKSFRQLSATLQVHGSKARIYGAFPENQMLTQPIQGYVTKPLEFYNCQEYQLMPDTLQYVVIHPYSPSQMPCRQLLDSQVLIPANHFENNGKWVELYQVDASSSATMSATK